MAFEFSGPVPPDPVEAMVFDGELTGNRVYVLGSHLPCATSVETGQLLTLRTMDASGNQIREGTRAEDLDQTALFPVTGPVAVRGVRAGDTVGMHVHDVRLADEAYCWTRPGIGFGPDFGYHLRRIDLRRPLWPGLPDLSLELTPHVGTIGVLPSARRLARDLGSYGGNLDSVEIGPGSTVWVTAHSDGGGVFAGDVHASIGDAEICGTGLEAAAEVDLTITARRDWSSKYPVVERAGRAWMVAIGSTVDEALRLGCAELIELLASHLRVDKAESYLLVAQLLEARICQVVNPRASIALSLRQGLDACLMPPAMPGVRQSHPDIRRFS